MPEALAHKHVVFSSAGNDSIALVQWMIENGHTAYVVYSNTGWAQPGWGARVAKMFAWVTAHGCTPIELGSEGMVALAKRKKAFPRNQIQFCTSELKIKPAMRWLAEIDPDAELECCVGIRRCESASRARWPEHTEDSDKHGGRDLWAPLVRHDDTARDALILRAGWEPLPHRSMECFPCINANRNDMLLLDEKRIAYIESLETAMGHSPVTGKPKTFFRPYRHLEAIGIREVVRWAQSKRGKFEPKHYPVKLAEFRRELVRDASSEVLVQVLQGTTPRFHKKLLKILTGKDLARARAAVASTALKLSTEDVSTAPGEECDAGMCGM